MAGTLYEDQCTYMIISFLVPFRMRYLSDEFCREYQNTRFMFNDVFPKSCRLWNNVEK